MLRASALGMFLNGCAAWQAVFGPQVCPQPSIEFSRVPLLTCDLDTGDPAVTCCAYGAFSNGHSTGDLCFHVLCKTQVCGEYEFAETICVGPETPQPIEAKAESCEDEEPA